MGKVTERHMWPEGKVMGQEAGSAAECVVVFSSSRPYLPEPVKTPLYCPLEARAGLGD